MTRRHLGMLVACAPLLLQGCGMGAGRPAVSLKFQTEAGTPANASVYIDEEYVGPLGYVAAHGVRLPIGEHRITVQRSGYFPWDRLVESDRKPILLRVKMVRIPD
ncbi:MAG TPA: PEGA domain-containing protein [Polyangiaceae bacterium]|nr:PEGA domain-containing protein [Polyangiaceae bacterium]